MLRGVGFDIDRERKGLINCRGSSGRCDCIRGKYTYFYFILFFLKKKKKKSIIFCGPWLNPFYERIRGKKSYSLVEISQLQINSIG